MAFMHSAVYAAKCSHLTKLFLVEADQVSSHKFVGDCTHPLTLYLKNRGVPEAAMMWMLFDPVKFFHRDILRLSQTSKFYIHLVMEVANALKIDPSTVDTDFRSLLEGMGTDKDRWSDLVANLDYLRDLDIREVADGLDVASALPQKEMLQAVKDKTLGQLRKAHYDKMQKASQFSADDLTKMGEACLAKCATQAQKTAFNEVFQMSKDLVGKNPRNVSYPPQSLFVAQASELLLHNDAVFLQLDPGNGKTFVAGMVIKNIHKRDPNQHVTVVLANDYLKREAEDTNDEFGHVADKVHFITVDELETNFDSKQYYIVDETWACLNESNLIWDDDLRLTGIWACGVTAKTLFLCGSVDEHTRAFYDSVWKGCVHLTCGRNSDFARDVKEKARFKVKVPGNAAATATALFAEARNIVLHQDRSVLVFGLTYDPRTVGHRLGGAEYWNIDSDDAARQAGAAAPGAKPKIYFVNDRYKIGMSLRFTTEAAVLVYAAKKRPEKEDLLQMFGRGCRNMSIHLGTLYCAGVLGSKETIEAGYTVEKGPQLKEPAGVLRRCRGLDAIGAKLAKQIRTALTRTYWRTTLASFENGLTPEMTGKLKKNMV